MPNLTWYGSPNFTPGRIDVEYVVIHWMDGYLAGADATFQNTTRQTSAHYGVEDDTIHQYVDEANTAWHAGSFDANQRSIGIEHSAMPGRPASDATYASTIWLITGICQRYGLDPNVAILPHQRFTSTDCPGTMDLARIKAGVLAALGGVSAQSGTINPIQEDDMPTADELAKAIFDYKLPTPDGKGTTLGAVTGWSDTNLGALGDTVRGIPTKVLQQNLKLHSGVIANVGDVLGDIQSKAGVAAAVAPTPAATAPALDLDALATLVADKISAQFKAQINK